MPRPRKAAKKPFKINLPGGTPVINIENLLHQEPPGSTKPDKPWYFFDYIDPAAKYRRGYSHVSTVDFVPEGEEDTSLTDNEEYEDGKPVQVYGYV
jgi:hypothetical protein